LLATNGSEVGQCSSYVKLKLWSTWT